MCNHYYITLFITITSDVLIKIFKNLIISISYMQFSRYIDDNEDSLSSGEYEIRTRDLLLARQALSQLSYTPKSFLEQAWWA